MESEYRITWVLQIFTLILVFKGISATYFATLYSMQGQLKLVEHYANLLKTIPLFLIISLVFMAIPLIFNLKRKVKKILDYLAIGLMLVGLLLLFI